MLRALRRIALLLCVAALGGGALLTVTTKPKLDDATAAVQHTWNPIREALNARFAGLQTVNNGIASPGRPPTSSGALNDALRSWASASNTSVADQIILANRLVGLGRRIAAIATHSPRYAANADVGAGLTTMQRNTPNANDIDNLNAAVDKANEIRDGFLRRLVATALDYRDLPHFER